MTAVPPVFNFHRWVDEHAHLLRPPVNNQVLYPGPEDLIIQVVGGPNVRTDYHVDPFEEWFFQIRGAMHVEVMTDRGPERVDIREGEVWMLPRGVPHSPQRPDEGSVGIVVEKVRPEGTTESFLWYCPACHHELHRVTLQVRDIVKDLPPAFERFYGDPARHRCGRCGTVHPGRVAV